MKSPPRHSVRRLVFIVVAAVFLLVVTTSAMIWNRGRIEQSRVEALEQFDAGIYAQYAAYEFKPSRDRLTSTCTPDETTTLRLGFALGQRVLGYGVEDEPTGAASLLVPMFGEFCFADVTKIYIADERFSDNDVDLLFAFPELRELEIVYSNLSDRGLEKLTELKQLKKLHVDGERVTASGFAALSRCSNLRELDLRYVGVEVDEKTIAELKQALPDCVIRHR